MILAILVGSHLGNIPIKYESHWPKGSGGVSFLTLSVPDVISGRGDVGLITLVDVYFTKITLRV